MIHGLFLNYAQTIYLRSGKLKLLYCCKLIFLIDSSIYLNDCHVTIVWIPSVADVAIVGLRSQWEEVKWRVWVDMLIGILCEHKFLVFWREFHKFHSKNSSHVRIFLPPTSYAWDQWNWIMSHLKGDVIISKRDF